MHTADNPAALWSASQPELRGQALLDTQQQVWLPYDAAIRQLAPQACRPAPAEAGWYNVHKHPGSPPDFDRIQTLLVINGFGLALGDSIIGLTALLALLKRYPHLHITLWRSCSCPDYVEAIYQLAQAQIPHLQVVHLPQPVQASRNFDAVVDMSDFLFWEDFNQLPMVDFFLHAMGLNPLTVESANKRNLWLQQCVAPAPASDSPYVLFCPQSSTPLRTIPQHLHADMVDAISRSTGLPVWGFDTVQHPHYRNVRGWSTRLEGLLRLVAGARHVYCTDTAIVHIADGLNVPCSAWFISINPKLRTRDYPLCSSYWLGQDSPLAGLHETTNPGLLSLAAGRFAARWREALDAVAVG